MAAKDRKRERRDRHRQTEEETENVYHTYRKVKYISF